MSVFSVAFMRMIDLLREEVGKNTDVQNGTGHWPWLGLGCGPFGAWRLWDRVSVEQGRFTGFGLEIVYT